MEEVRSRTQKGADKKWRSWIGAWDSSKNSQRIHNVTHNIANYNNKPFLQLHRTSINNLPTTADALTCIVQNQSGPVDMSYWTEIIFGVWFIVNFKIIFGINFRVLKLQCMPSKKLRTSPISGISKLVANWWTFLRVFVSRNVLQFLCRHHQLSGTPPRNMRHVLWGNHAKIFARLVGQNCFQLVL